MALRQTREAAPQAAPGRVRAPLRRAASVPGDRVLPGPATRIRCRGRHGRKGARHRRHVIDTGRRIGDPPAREHGEARQAPASRVRRDEEKLFAACQSSRSAALPIFVRLAIETAMRLSEMLGLEWHHVDLNRRLAFLPHTKNGHSRSSPFPRRGPPTRVLAALAHGACVPAWSGLDSVESVWRRAVAGARLEDLRFHDLRHEATSRLFERGLNPMQVAAITGHKALSRC